MTSDHGREGFRYQLGHIVVSNPNVCDRGSAGVGLALLVRPGAVLRLDEANSLVGNLTLHDCGPVHHVSSYFVFIFGCGWIRHLRSLAVANTSMDEVTLILKHFKDLRPPLVYRAVFLHGLLSCKDSLKADHPVRNVQVDFDISHGCVALANVAEVVRIPEDPPSMSLMKNVDAKVLLDFKCFCQVLTSLRDRPAVTTAMRVDVNSSSGLGQGNKFFQGSDVVSNFGASHVSEVSESSCDD